jgi:hypothetical protein
VAATSRRRGPAGDHRPGLTATTPPTAPANLRVVNTTDFTWLSMTWDRFSDGSGNITYHVQRLPTATDTWVEVGFTTLNLVTLHRAAGRRRDWRYCRPSARP